MPNFFSLFHQIFVFFSIGENLQILLDFFSFFEILKSILVKNFEIIFSRPLTSTPKNPNADFSVILNSLFHLIRYMICRDITYGELSAVLNFVFTVKNCDLVNCLKNGKC